LQWSLTALNVTIHSVPVRDSEPMTAALDWSEAR
jgi:hypothetical protein